jgi:hypothetical protein
MSSGHKFRSDGNARSAPNVANATRSPNPPLYLLHDELIYVALQLTEPDSLLALRASSKILRERLNARVRLDEHVCTTSPTDSFAYDLALNHFTKTHIRVPVDVGERLVSARWAVGDRQFVGFSKAVLTRRVPNGEFADITPAECKGGGIMFAAGYGCDVWVGTASVVVHVRLTPNLSAIECTISLCEMSAACRSACANQYGLFGCGFVPASPGTGRRGHSLSRRLADVSFARLPRRPLARLGRRSHALPPCPAAVPFAQLQRPSISCCARSARFLLRRRRHDAVDGVVVDVCPRGARRKRDHALDAARGLAERRDLLRGAERAQRHLD